jgi:polyhydroxybutyrate depolymerase
VLLLRGRGGTAAGLARISQFDTLADREGIVAVYPEGVERSWGDGRGTSPAEQQHVDDVGFLAAVIDDARDERPWTRRACT